MVNFFSHSSPIVSHKLEVPPICRIATFGISSLDDRSRDILEQRWLASNKKTLHELAEQYQVSAERVRQLEKNALNKLKLAIGLSS